MKTVGIAIEVWKLPIFDRHLKQAGYEYTQHPAEGVLLLKVKTTNILALHGVTQRASEEAQMTGQP